MKHLTKEILKQYAQLCYEQGLRGNDAWEHFRELYRTLHNTTIPNCGIKTDFINLLETLA